MHSFPSFSALARVALPLVFVAGACASGESAPGSGGRGGTGATAGDGGSGGTGGSGASVPEGATSIDAVQAALEAGEISEVDALRYKVFAVFGDERLPEQFRSAAPMQDGTQVLIELVERFDSLPVNVQNELDLFLRPPSDPLSWYQLREAESAQKDHNLLFDHISAVNGEVLVQWPNGKGHLLSDAEKVAAALSGPEGVWTKLTTLMGREPLRDEGIIEKYNGGDGRYDIYVIEDSNVTTRNLQTAFGWTSPYRAGTEGRKQATFMVMNRDRISTSSAGFDTKVKSNLAHEFMHVLQFAYDVAEPWRSYHWLMESTSTWAEHFVFPNDDIEQEDAPAYLRDPHFALTSLSGTHEYGAYLYWYFLTENPGGDPGTIAEVWALSESMNSEEAANMVSPGGFEATFADFAVANWNQAPFSDMGNAPWDVYTAEGMPDIADATRESPAPNPEDDIEVSFELGGVARLSATYVHYDLSSPNISTVLFANGYTFDLAEGVPDVLQDSSTADTTLYATRIPEEERKGRQVIALMKQNGTWRLEPFDLTEVAFAPFCNDASSESLEELLLIFINAEHRTDKPAFAVPRGLPPRLLTSNIGCGKWSGTGSAQETILDGSDVQFMNLDITKIEFTRPTLTLDQIANGDGQIRFGDEIMPPSSFSALNWFQGDAYELTDLAATWTFDEDYISGGGSCAGSGSGAFTEADASSSTFKMGTHLRSGRSASDTPPLYRSFFYQLWLYAPGEPISGTCVSNGQTSPYTSELAVLMESGYRIPGLEILRIEPSGDRINASWSFEDSDMELDLTNGPIP